MSNLKLLVNICKNISGENVLINITDLASNPPRQKWQHIKAVTILKIESREGWVSPNCSESALNILKNTFWSVLQIGEEVGIGNILC